MATFAANHPSSAFHLKTNPAFSQHSPSHTLGSTSTALEGTLLKYRRTRTEVWAREHLSEGTMQKPNLSLQRPGSLVPQPARLVLNHQQHQLLHIPTQGQFRRKGRRENTHTGHGTSLLWGREGALSVPRIAYAWMDFHIPLGKHYTSMTPTQKWELAQNQLVSPFWKADELVEHRPSAAVLAIDYWKCTRDFISYHIILKEK